MTLVEKRSKLIILADKFGWDFVKEYKRDEIASNSDGEKHIKKCLKTISTARVQIKKKNSTRRVNFPTTVTPYPWYNYRPFVSYSHSPSSNMSFRSVRPFMGPCHSCGKFGHYWKACPTRQPGSSSTRHLVSLPVHSGNTAAPKFGPNAS